MNEPVLSVKDLKVYYYVDAGAVRAVDGISFDLDPGTKMGLVGESGSGKSTIAWALLRMIRPPGRIESGEVMLDGEDLLKFSGERMREYRLRTISMIPQGAMNSLHPLIRIKQQIIESLEDHGVNMSKSAYMDHVYRLLDSVELERKVADMYPHELSGGMKQRVCVAIATCMRPKVIIADEPTSALDVVVQRQVMETLERLREQLDASILLIGHDMGLMAQVVQRLAVMYAGRLIEVGDVRDIYADPLHPYTRVLIKSLPVLDRKGVFQGLPGIPPSLMALPSGCTFNPRCPEVMDICRVIAPDFIEVRPGRWVSCHLHGVQS